MKKINFKTFFAFLVIMASICSYTFLNNVDKVKEPLVTAKNEVIGQQENTEEQTQEVALLDVSFLTKAIDFLEKSLPAD